MNWLIIVVVAYALNAIAIAIDKALLKKAVPHPAAYTFVISVLGVLALVLLPWDWQVPAQSLWFYIILTGSTFTVGLYLMFVALQRADASRVTPFIGGLNPFFIFVLAFIFLGERLSNTQVGGFFLILFGTLLISLELKRNGNSKKAFLYALPAAALFAISYVLTKYIYLNQSFISAFVFIRLASVAAALLLLLSAANRRAIFGSVIKTNASSRSAFFIGQICGALAMVMVSWAISLASVSLVNALQGLQYVFLFGIVVVLKKSYPKLLDEDLSKKIYLQKIFSILLIVAGLFFLSF